MGILPMHIIVPNRVAHHVWWAQYRYKMSRTFAYPPTGWRGQAQLARVDDNRVAPFVNLRPRSLPGDTMFAMKGPPSLPRIFWNVSRAFFLNFPSILCII